MDTFTLSGGSTGPLDFQDLDKYLTDDKNGESFNIDEQWIEVYANKPSGGRTLARRVLAGVTMSFDVLCTGGSYGEAKDNYDAIASKINEAADYQLLGAGDPVILTELRSDQSSPTELTLVGGYIERKNLKFMVAGKIECTVRLELSP